MREVRLLVVLSLVEAERVDDIDDSLGRVLGLLLTILSRRVGANICAGIVRPLVLVSCIVAQLELFP